MVERDDKLFKLEMGGKTESVSLDRLKPVFLDFTEPIPVAAPTRRGRPRKCQSAVLGGSSVADLMTTRNEQRTLSLHIALSHLDHLN